jgi:anti-sigma regulatory factor (Ser/Thr protein kinase)
MPPGGCLRMTSAAPTDPLQRPASEAEPAWIEVGAAPADYERARLQLEAALGAGTPPATAALAFAVALIFEEVATNARRHGGASRVRVLVRHHADTVELAFEDDGTAFDPTTAESADRPRSLDEAEPGGLGLVLLRHYAAAWAYDRHHGVNHLRVTVARGAG